MSLKATIFFSLWTSFFCALFNGIYMLIPVLGGHPWIMFVCLAVFFALNSTPKDVPNMMVSATCGVFWGQFDLFLMVVMGGLGGLFFGFIPILVGTAITMILHIFYLAKTPASVVPFIFAGVALTFATGTGFLAWPDILGLWLSMLFGLILCGVCAYGMGMGIQKFPAEQ